MTEKGHYNKVAGKSTERTIAISDGVFGVALTLLMIELKAPVSEAISSEKELIDLFLELSPKFLVSFLAFMTTGIFWMGQSTQYQYIKKSDRNLSWINLLFLLQVALLPFTTAFLGNYINKFKFPIGIYWLNLFLLGAILYIHWVYAVKHNLVDPEIIEKVNKPIKTRIIVAQSLYLAGVLLCFVNSYLSIGVIIAIQLNYAFVFINGPKT